MTRVLDYNATVTRRIEVASGLDIFQVTPDEPIAPFQPGQYLTLGLNRPTDDPEDTRPLSVLRPMTIASGNHETTQLEFYVQYVDKPEARLPLTHLMWELREGDRLYVRPAVTGRFTAADTYKHLGDRKLVMVAGGTGIAPFLSMLRTLAASGSSLEKYMLLFGAYNPNYLSHQDEIDRWVLELGLTFIPVMSRAHESADWPGLIGRVDHLLAPERIHEVERQGKISLYPEETVIMACGLGDVISGTLQNLLSRGFIPEHRRMRKLLEIDGDKPATLFYEQFDAQPLLDFRDESLLNTLRRKWSDRRAA